MIDSVMVRKRTLKQPRERQLDSYVNPLHLIEATGLIRIKEADKRVFLRYSRIVQSHMIYTKIQLLRGRLLQISIFNKAQRSMMDNLKLVGKELMLISKYDVNSKLRLPRIALQGKML